ncbi:unnamed protein product [Caenorhabditis auriculariae]|uniref:Uncharacterized protein n=1 Tax=Caenorhabditis auriculariae TaxID=2777116 RepID=A0A8S1H2C5_9PELO|nr:unnamed protein product [Caenorhabditis auriculariae]
MKFLGMRYTSQHKLLFVYRHVIFEHVGTLKTSVMDAKWDSNVTVSSTALRTSYRALERALIGTTRFVQWKKNRGAQTSVNNKSGIRRQDDRWPTRLTHWIPRNIKRPLGRPPTRWTDYFHKNISQPGRHWMTVAQDRAAWRTCGPR